jgi:hypothetical protein
MRSFSFMSKTPDFSGAPVKFTEAEGDEPLGRGVGAFDGGGVCIDEGAASIESRLFFKLCVINTSGARSDAAGGSLVAFFSFFAVE